MRLNKWAKVKRGRSAHRLRDERCIRIVVTLRQLSKEQICLESSNRFTILCQKQQTKCTLYFNALFIFSYLLKIPLDE